MTVRHNTTRFASVAALLVATLGLAHDASAQVDPLLFLKRTKPNVLIVVDTGNRMQRDASNPADYLDANVYAKTGAAYEVPLGVGANANVSYRRKYKNLQNSSNGDDDRFTADRIEVVGDVDQTAFSTFGERSRLSVARRALIEAITANQYVARFGLITMRQDTPQLGVQGNSGPVRVPDSANQKTPTDGPGDNRWLITRPTVNSANSSVSATLPQVQPDATNANAQVLAKLALNVGQAGALTPGGKDDKNTVDAPVEHMLDDTKTEAGRLIGLDTECRNTVAVLVVGGGEGNNPAGDPASKASQFLSVLSGHRVPIHVIALAPADADRTQLQLIASNSGGLYTEITPAMVSATTAGRPVPEVVKAVNAAVQNAFAAQADFDAGHSTESQVTSPIIGTVNLENALDITGAPLVNSRIEDPVTHVKIPQRSNLMVTSGFALPGFDGRLRGFRVYRPEADTTKPSGYKFVSDGTRLWLAHTPASASRNIYTALPDGTVVAFNDGNAATLTPYLLPGDATNTTDAARIIKAVRELPLGAVVGSTPAVMDAPSLDPPPDSDYPAFVEVNKDRRSVVWVGANDGMLHAIDSRLGVEVWAFIPFNLLPKLNALRSGQPVGDFRFFADGSPKVADVKIDGHWRTHLIMGEGPGGTFYQSFDVTLDDIGTTVSPTSDAEGDVLTYFATTTAVKLNWAFPRYSKFDPTVGAYGDVAATASAAEKSVGETWSDPAVGQIESPSGPFAVLTGSGFLKYSVQQQSNRTPVVGGSTFYVLDAKTGSVLASRDVGNDNKGETGPTADNCAIAGDCSFLKNALQADPVATGPADSRFITKAYVGDLDGKIWRFDIKLTDGAPTLAAPTKLFDAQGQPNVSSMATVNVGGTKQYFFQGTGSDLLPSVGVSQIYKLAVVLDNGATGANTASIPLERTDGKANDEKVTAFPAVAGDIVFFTTTTFKPETPCVPPDANLYAFTFIGGPAYDTNGDGTITKKAGGDSVKVRTVTGARASAPFIVDQHLVFAAGDKIELFGDPQDFNNGVGQVGVRILSWRDVR